jgi:LPXTG-motif cell wall-anchored protein
MKVNWWIVSGILVLAALVWWFGIRKKETPQTVNITDDAVQEPADK